MITKTIKLEPNTFTNFMDELDLNDVIFLTGARGVGKSYPSAKKVKEMLLADANAKFAYMRIRNEELATYESWCKDLDLLEIAEGSESVKLERGKPGKGDICLTGYDAEGIQVYRRIIGKCISLETAHQFKSGKYDEFVAIVFEEYAHVSMTPANEEKYVFSFLENVVSIFRDRPKKIFLMANNLKTLPMLEREIDALTGDIFVNPIKYKIFRKRGGEKKTKSKSKFLDYLDGELYEDDTFKVRINEFFKLYTNKDFVIYQHMVYNRKFYVTGNKANERMYYREIEYQRLKYFCQGSSLNEFYYQHNGIEKMFFEQYVDTLAEISQLLSENSRFIL